MCQKLKSSIGHGSNNNFHIYINEQQLQQTDNFVYLGGDVGTHDGVNGDINRRKCSIRRFPVCPCSLVIVRVMPCGRANTAYTRFVHWLADNVVLAEHNWCGHVAWGRARLVPPHVGHAVTVPDLLQRANKFCSVLFSSSCIVFVHAGCDKQKFTDVWQSER